MAHLFALRRHDDEGNNTVPSLRAIAHDLNNLLTAISGYGNLLVMDESVPAEARRDAGEIVDAAAHAVGLVRQLQVHA
jgi:signal transduction histidine kinase